ncbi:MAG: VOC family protein [Firmicutes bacterium]|nr:VOC family protein [Bacillota bacterium]
MAENTIESSVIFFPVSDIKATVAFYTGLLGLSVSQVQGGGQCIIFDTGYGYLGFCQYGDGRPMPTGDYSPCISFNCNSTEEVDLLFARLKEQAVCVLQEPAYHERFPVYSAFLSDPDGYKVELQKILSAEPAARSVDRPEEESAEGFAAGSYPCPVCKRLVFEEKGGYEICPVCGWEDDPVQRKDPHFAGGANRMSLQQAIEAYEKEHSCHE